MKLIKQQAEMHNQKYGNNLILDCLKHIEYCARLCYKSTDKIVDGDTLENSSCTKFVNMLINRGHMAMLEHGTMYLHIHYKGPRMNSITESVFNTFVDNKYSVVQENSGDIFITTNYRVLIEMDFFNYLERHKKECNSYAIIKFVKPDARFAKRTTLRLVCDRAIANELVRHRVFSFAQESTRYCNYNKTKFENSCTFINPSIYSEFDGLSEEELKNNPIYKEYIDSFVYSEKKYFNLIKLGMQAQKARDVLSLGLKTELMMTGFNEDWVKTKECYKQKSIHSEEVLISYTSGVMGLRLDKAAHPKIRLLLKNVLTKLTK